LRLLTNFHSRVAGISFFGPATITTPNQWSLQKATSCFTRPDLTFVHPFKLVWIDVFKELKRFGSLKAFDFDSLGLGRLLHDILEDVPLSSGSSEPDLWRMRRDGKKDEYES
jgi:hypothetical protein